MQNPEAKNVNACKSLICRYETITLSEIRQEQMRPLRLTGFGNHGYCQLCAAVGVETQEDTKKCAGCVHANKNFVPLACKKGRAEPTYRAIQNAETARELQQAFRARAKYLRSIIGWRKR